MADQSPDHESFVNRKRPAMEGIVQHLIGPTTLLDQVIGGKPYFPKQENEFEPDASRVRAAIQNQQQPED